MLKKLAILLQRVRKSPMVRFYPEIWQSLEFYVQRLAIDNVDKKTLTCSKVETALAIVVNHCIET